MSFSQPTLYSFINYTVQPRSQASPVLFFGLYNTRKQKSGEKLQYMPTTFHNIPWFSFVVVHQQLRGSYEISKLLVLHGVHSLVPDL